MESSKMNEYDTIVDKLIDEKTDLYNKSEKLKKENKKLKDEVKRLKRELRNGV